MAISTTEEGDEGQHQAGAGRSSRGGRGSHRGVHRGIGRRGQRGRGRGFQELREFGEFYVKTFLKPYH